MPTVQSKASGAASSAATSAASSRDGRLLLSLTSQYLVCSSWGLKTAKKAYKDALKKEIQLQQAEKNVAPEEEKKRIEKKREPRNKALAKHRDRLQVALVIFKKPLHRLLKRQRNFST